MQATIVIIFSRLLNFAVFCAERGGVK